VSGICVIELRSHSDRPPVLRAKMQEYIENGANLGWMIDPDARTVEVYRAERDAEILAGVDSAPGPRTCVWVRSRFDSRLESTRQLGVRSLSGLRRTSP
jgi:hypothetical protein